MKSAKTELLVEFPEEYLEGKKRLTKKDVASRISDWKTRLEKLMDDLEEWRGLYASDFTPHRYEIPQLNEEMMRKFNVAPEKVPAFSLTKQNRRIAFVPSALWIIGANGRVNITTNTGAHILVDMGGRNGQPSDWKIASRDSRKALIPFDQIIFKRIIGNKAV